MQGDNGEADGRRGTEQSGMIHDDLRSRLEKRIAPEKQRVSGAADGRWYISLLKIPV